MAVLLEEQLALVTVPPQAALGGDDGLVPPALNRLADDFFAAAEALGGGRVDEVDAAVEASLDRANRFGVVGITPPWDELKKIHYPQYFSKNCVFLK
jgi:hypothetical protein